MPQYSTIPTHPLDIAARTAFRVVMDGCGNNLAAKLDCNPRTVQRIYAGRSYLAPGLARAAADFAAPEQAAALIAWADHCQQED